MFRLPWTHLLPRIHFSLIHHFQRNNTTASSNIHRPLWYRDRPFAIEGIINCQYIHGEMHLSLHLWVRVWKRMCSGLRDSRACPSNRFIGRWMACHCRIIPCECFTQSFSDIDCQSLHLGTPITALLSDGAAVIFSQPEEVMRCELGCFHTRSESESWFPALNFLTFASSTLTLAACVYHCI